MKKMPIFTVVLIVVNTFATMRGLSVGYDNHTSQQGGFGLGDLLAMFSHKDWGHFAYNMAGLALFGATAESFFKRKLSYLVAVLTAMVGTCAYSEVIDLHYIGASGWVAALPYMASAAGLGYWWRNRRYESKANAAAWGSGISLLVGSMMNAVDAALVNKVETLNVGFNLHLAGAAIGLATLVGALGLYGRKLLKTGSLKAVLGW